MGITLVLHITTVHSFFQSVWPAHEVGMLSRYQMVFLIWYFDFAVSRENVVFSNTVNLKPAVKVTTQLIACSPLFLARAL